MAEGRFLDELTSFLVSQECQDLLTIHPNQATSLDFRCPDSWLPWWTWAATPGDVSERKWLVLWRYYVSPDRDNLNFMQIPDELRDFIDKARHLQLSRTPGEEILPLGPVSDVSHSRPFPLPSKSPVPSGHVNTHGMSPKKAHEVQTMTVYTSQLLSSLAKQGTSIRHVVDIGAGQAYVTRALRDELGLDILAVDWSPVQAEGAARREDAQTHIATEEHSKGSLTYRMLSINKDSLLAVTDEWSTQVASAQPPLPVLLLALHACGSLTLDVLRAFCERVKDAKERAWKPVASLIVGCCYNLLRPEDCRSMAGSDIHISANHLQLAAQVPRYWDRTPKAFEEAKLAVRKVAWRALLEDVLARRHRNAHGKRLGRLNNAAYKSWDGYLSVAEKKLGVALQGTALDAALERRVEVLQLLRCVLGPVLESFLLLDRKAWLSHSLADTRCSVGLVNLFDQRLDSARNVAIVIVSE